MVQNNNPTILRFTFKNPYIRVSLPFSQLKKQLGGLVVACQPAALKMGFHTPDGEPKNFQYRLSSAETHQPVDRIGHEARG